MPDLEAYGLQQHTTLGSILSSARGKKEIEKISRLLRFHPQNCCSLEVLFSLTILCKLQAIGCESPRRIAM